MRGNARAYAYSSQIKGCIATAIVDCAEEQAYNTCQKCPNSSLKCVLWLWTKAAEEKKNTYNVPTKKTEETCSFRFVDKFNFQVQKSGNSSITKSDSMLKIPVE